MLESASCVFVSGRISANPTYCPSICSENLGVWTYRESGRLHVAGDRGEQEPSGSCPGEEWLLRNLHG